MTEQKAGSLRDRIDVLRIGTDEVGSRGQRVAEFFVLDSRWSKFAFLSGSELEQARKIWTTTNASCIIRKPSDYTITTKDRVRFKGIDYGIGAVMPSGESHDDLNLLLAEVQ